MSEPRSGPPPVRRPDTARPREHAEAANQPAPPTRAELEAIELQLAELTELAGSLLEPWPADTDAHGGEPGSVGAVGADAARRGPPTAVRLRWPGHGPTFNHLAVVRWPERGWEDEVRRFASAARSSGELPVVGVAEGLTTPPDLGARLRELGWIPLLRERIHWTRRAAVVPHLDPAMRIELVTPDRAASYEAVEREAFGLPEAEAVERAASLERGIRAGRIRAYLVVVRREPVATARLVASNGVASLSGVGVVPAHRRRGYGSLITTVATRAGLAMGNSLVWLAVVLGNTAADRMYAGLDYRPVFGWDLLVDRS